MIERIARALCDDTLSRWRSPIALQAEPWREFIPAARAVLQAIREPSVEQLIAAQRQMFNATRSAPPSSAIAIGYTAMIDAALSE